MAHHEAMAQVHAARENGENLTVAEVKRRDAPVEEVSEIFFDKLHEFFRHTECGAVLEFRGSDGNSVDLFCGVHDRRFTFHRSKLEEMAGLSGKFGS